VIDALTPTAHVAIMRAAIMAWLRPHAGGQYLDATLGGGGHTAALLESAAPAGRVLAIDADPAARARVSRSLAPFIAAGRLTLAAGNFRDMATLAAAHGVTEADGVLMDLGLSSDQLADRERGFSFATDAPLDMRFDPGQGESAADLLATRSETEIADILYQYGEERRSRAIARRIVAQRATQPITRTNDLAALVARAVPGRPGGIHPATRTFQALRIAVNGELDSLTAALPQALALLRPGGRIAVMSFHSLEDRIVKHWMRQEAKGCVCPPELPTCVCGREPTLRILTPHPQMADAAEVAANPRSSSAKLRVAERLAREGGAV
jgi:16S rRNA (cytosine1402-N4)-methyltransferase